MYFFHEGLVSHALQVFRATQFNRPEEGDAFFGTFAPGNTMYFSDRPHERFSDYEELLFRLMQADPQKYQKMHKGTPFGFMSWLAFDLRNYEKALFYLDAGISEDVRKADPPETWIDNPGPKVLILDPDPNNRWFKRTIEPVREMLQREFTRFNAVSSRAPIDISTWQRFVRKLISDKEKRTIVSALYVFLLEVENHCRELKLREGSSGGSNQPFTVHLFTGGLLFESLLKQAYPLNDRGQPNKTLGNVLNMASFLTDFGLTVAPASVAQSLTEIHSAIHGSTSLETAFSTAAKLRNTTGHNLVWDDIFDAPAKYVELFQQVMNAILHVIARKFI